MDITVRGTMCLFIGKIFVGTSTNLLLLQPHRQRLVLEREGAHLAVSSLSKILPFCVLLSDTAFGSSAVGFKEE